MRKKKLLRVTIDKGFGILMAALVLLSELPAFGGATVKIAIPLVSATLSDPTKLESVRSNTLIDLIGNSNNIAPVMTSANAPSPNVVSTSGDYSAPYQPYKIFDGITNNDGLITGSSGYFQLDVGVGNTIYFSQYKVIGVEGGLASVTANPKNWTIKGSTTGAFAGEEVTLDTQTNQTGWTASQTRTFNVTTPQASRFIRMVITANNGSGSYTGMGELQFIPGYPVTSPYATLAEADSGQEGTVWDLSTISDMENLGGETGSIKYQYAYGDTASPSNWNGSSLTLSSLQGSGNVTGRYFKLRVYFNSTGPQNASISDLYITATLAGGSGGGISRSRVVNQ